MWYFLQQCPFLSTFTSEVKIMVENDVNTYILIVCMYLCAHSHVMCAKSLLDVALTKKCYYFANVLS